jgi:hypothetical protein
VALKDSDILNLPDAPDFQSAAPALSLNELIALCERMLPYTNAIRYSKPEPQFVGEAFRLYTEEKHEKKG